MNRITTKEYLIDITIHTLETTHQQNTKLKCQIYYRDDSYLRIQFQPLLKYGKAQFYGQHIRIPFSSEISLVFKLISINKKETFLGHYHINIEKMLNNKTHYSHIKDRLEESDSIVDFQCKIIDKQLLAESDEEQNQEGLVDINNKEGKSIATCMKRNSKHVNINKSISDWNYHMHSAKKKIEDSQVALTQDQYGKLVREAEDVLRKKQLFDQRNEVLSMFRRDSKGNMRTEKIDALRKRLMESRREHMKSTIVLYIIVSLIALFIGMKV